jgi:hypothetical protein
LDSAIVRNKQKTNKINIKKTLIVFSISMEKVTAKKTPWAALL